MVGDLSSSTDIEKSMLCGSIFDQLITWAAGWIESFAGLGRGCDRRSSRRGPSYLLLLMLIFMSGY